MRTAYRAYLGVPMPVYLDNDVSYGGLVHDISEKGVQVSGIEGRRNGTHWIGGFRRFTIRADFPSLLEPVEFVAECRWTKRAGRGRRVAGYMITEITRDNLNRLRRLMNEFNVEAAIEI